MRSLREVLAFADALASGDAAEPGETAAVCTVVRVTGSAYGRPGARLILTPNGERAGYVSGGCLETELARRVWGATADGPAVLAFDTRGNPRTPGGRYNAGCDGVIEVLCERLVTGGEGGLDDVRTAIETSEPIARRVSLPGDAGTFEETVEPPRPVTIFGAADDARPLCELAGVLGWSVTVVGRRGDLAVRGRFPDAARVLHADPAEALPRVPLRPHAAAVVMTHDYAGDLALLPALLASDIGYVGMLGPKRRIGRMLTDLHAAGRLPPPTQLEKLRTPIGLDIGAKTPAEIAAAVAAEIVAHFRGRPGGFLTDRTAPVHDPA